MSKQTKPTKQTKQSKPAKQTKQTKQTPAPKQRNTLLTIALVVVILHGIFMAAVFWTVRGSAQSTYAQLATWMMAFSAVADIIAAGAMWFWKKWGIYLYGVAAVAHAIATVMVTGDLLLIFGALLPPIIVLYIVMMQRDKFE